ncbi:MAG: NUDIX domain-containing protein [Bacteroidales bacterium]|nr:NUDIX domain-containing protein [Bacteroidales bacterium]MCF8337026.1 NUDIX domain-containing protein [Bacteroidales bacterium]
MYKVFFHEKMLLLAGSSPEVSPESGDIVYNIVEQLHLKNVVFNFLHSKKHNRVIFYHSNTDRLMELFSGLFTPVSAAGGVVSDQEEKILFILRNGVWDLPKGQAEEGEKAEETAVREVKEETGLQQVAIQQLIKPTFHIYYRDGTYNLKTTYWYHMTAPASQALKPQTEEGIEQIVWVDKEDIPDYANYSYKSIYDLLEYYLHRKDDEDNVF